MLPPVVSAHACMLVPAVCGCRLPAAHSVLPSGYVCPQLIQLETCSSTCSPPSKTTRSAWPTRARPSGSPPGPAAAPFRPPSPPKTPHPLTLAAARRCPVAARPPPPATRHKPLRCASRLPSEALGTHPAQRPLQQLRLAPPHGPDPHPKPPLCPRPAPPLLARLTPRGQPHAVTACNTVCTPPAMLFYMLLQAVHARGPAGVPAAQRHHHALPGVQLQAYQLNGLRGRCFGYCSKCKSANTSFERCQ